MEQNFMVCISEIATSHVCGLRKTRHDSDRKLCFSNQKSNWKHNVIYSGCQVVEWLQWGRR